MQKAVPHPQGGICAVEVPAGHGQDADFGFGSSMLGTFVRLGCRAHPRGHVLGTAGASVLRHGDAVLLSLLQTTPGRATEAFSQLLGAARSQTDAAPNPLTPCHRLAPASPPRGGRDRGDRGAAASPAPLLHGAGCFQLLSPGAWLLPRTSVWQSRHPAKEPCVASRAGGGKRPPPSLGSADGGLFLCFRRAWTGTKPCSRE